MFENVQAAPADPILGLSETFKKDPRPDKINLSVGVYQDAAGKTPVLATVHEAEERILRNEKNKSYLPIDGSPQYADLVQQLLLGEGHEAIKSHRCATAHTPGGTGGLRVAGDYIKQQHGKATVWVSDPTWVNHNQIFEAAGLGVKSYPYFDAKSNGLAFDAMIAALDKIPAGDVVLLHGCCHNPTGVDPTPAQWKTIAQVVARRGLLPLVDFAYQGFGDGLREDAVGLLELIGPDSELLICSSFSKNFGLYRDRVGALTVVAKNQQQAQNVLSQVKRCIRSNYSNPPAHGGLIVTNILSDPALRKQWEGEVAGMRARIKEMRELFVKTLAAKGVKADVSFITRQRGMFSFSGLNKDQVAKLKDQHGIYIVGSGRINVAGMNAQTMDRLCEAIKAVM
jgi:aspartate/tyrosine/aromatic aminotransferase